MNWELYHNPDTLSTRFLFLLWSNSYFGMNWLRSRTMHQRLSTGPPTPKSPYQYPGNHIPSACSLPIHSQSRHQQIEFRTFPVNCTHMLLMQRFDRSHSQSVTERIHRRHNYRYRSLLVSQNLHPFWSRIKRSFVLVRHNTWQDRLYFERRRWRCADM